MEARASPVRAGASPAPNLGSGFTSARLSPKGRGDPPGGEGEGRAAPPRYQEPLHPGRKCGNPQGGRRARRQPPVKDQYETTCFEPIPLFPAP